MLIENLDNKDFIELIKKASYPKYLYWDKIKHRDPIKDLTT